jgi:hypothetical protein
MVAVPARATIAPQQAPHAPPLPPAPFLFATHRIHHPHNGPRTQVSIHLLCGSQQQPQRQPASAAGCGPARAEVGGGSRRNGGLWGAVGAPCGGLGGGACTGRHRPDQGHQLRHQHRIHTHTDAARRAMRRAPAAQTAAKRDAIVPKAVPVEVAMLADEGAFIGGVALTMTAITLLVSVWGGVAGARLWCEQPRAGLQPGSASPGHGAQLAARPSPGVCCCGSGCKGPHTPGGATMDRCRVAALPSPDSGCSDCTCAAAGGPA